MRAQQEYYEIPAFTPAEHANWTETTAKAIEEAEALGLTSELLADRPPITLTIELAAEELGALYSFMLRDGFNS